MIFEYPYMLYLSNAINIDDDVTCHLKMSEGLCRSYLILGIYSSLGCNVCYMIIANGN